MLKKIHLSYAVIEKIFFNDDDEDDGNDINHGNSGTSPPPSPLKLCFSCLVALHFIKHQVRSNYKCLSKHQH